MEKTKETEIFDMTRANMTFSGGRGFIEPVVEFDTGHMEIQEDKKRVWLLIEDLDNGKGVFRKYE